MTDELLQLADAIAGDYWLPGADADDVRQVARIAAWEATRAYRPELGVPLRGFVALVVRRRLASALKVARRRGALQLSEAVRVVVTDAGDELDALELLPDERADVLELVEQRERLRRLRAALPQLSTLERSTLADVLAGRSSPTSSKSVDNALNRARGKLRAA